MIRQICLAILPIVAFHSILAQCPTNEADLANGGVFSGNCSLNVGNSITITNDVTWNSGTLTITGNNGEFFLQATFNLNGGTVDLLDGNDGDSEIQNGGSLIVASGATFSEDGFIRVENGGDLVISGTVESTQQFIDIDAGGSITINNGGLLESDEDILIQGDADVLAGGNMTITNSGEINVTGTLDVFGTVTTAGSGADGNLEANGGTINIYTGGTANVSDDLKAYNGGTVYVQSGGTIDVGDNMVNAQTGAGGSPSTGTFIIDGEVNVTDNVTIFDTTPDSDLSGAGTITTGGTFTDNEGTSSFSGCGGGNPCIGTDIPLPVELTRFFAEENTTSVMIKWNTASEINNEGFYVQKSYDGVSFESIGFIEGHGTTSEPQQYAFEDINKNQNCYYRLQQVDFDGAFEYHPTIYVEINSALDINVYPNPVVDLILFTGIKSEVYEVSLVDHNGKLLYNSGNQTLQKVEKDINQVLPNLVVNHTYFLRLSSPNTSRIFKLFKQ